MFLDGVVFDMDEELIPPPRRLCDSSTAVHSPTAQLKVICYTPACVPPYLLHDTNFPHALALCVPRNALMVILHPADRHTVKLGFGVHIPPGYLGRITSVSDNMSLGRFQVEPTFIEAGDLTDCLLKVCNPSTYAQRLSPGDLLAKLVLVPLASSLDLHVEPYSALTFVE